MKTILKLLPSVLLVVAACASPKQKEQPIQKPAAIVVDTIYKKPVKNNITTMKELGDRFGAKKQAFTINNLKDTLIVGKQGTNIYLPKGCFIPSSAKMKLVLKEVYQPKDFIYNNLTTETTDGKLLSSNGMIYMDVESDVRVTINKSNPIKVKFPSRDTKPSDLFMSVNDEHGNIKWKTTNNNRLPTTKPLTRRRKQKVETEGTYTFEKILGRYSMLDMGNAFCYKGYDTIRKGLEYPSSLKHKNITGFVYLDLRINDIGQLENVKLVQGLTKEMDEMIINAVKKKKEWVPGFLGGEPAPSIIRYKFQVTGKDKYYRIDLPRQVYHMSELDSVRYKYWLSIKENKRIFNEKLTLGSNDVVTLSKDLDVQGYIYPLLDLGRWINCDRIILPPTKAMQTQLIMKSSVYTNVNMLAILLDMNRSMLNCTLTRDGFFKSPVLGKNSKVVMVGIANASDNSPMLFIKRFNGITKDTIDVQFKKVTYRQLKEEIDNIKG